MQVEFIILAIGALMVYNVYTDGKLTKTLLSYTKYYTIVGIVAAALFLCWLFRHHPGKAHSMVTASRDYIKYLPVDAGTAGVLGPVLDFTARRMGAGLDSAAPVVPMSDAFAGGGVVGSSSGGGSRRVKRSVSESRKKYVAAQQGWKCGKCQQILPATYEVDHIVRLDRGGTNEITNLECLCPGCHREKTMLENL